MCVCFVKSSVCVFSTTHIVPENHDDNVYNISCLTVTFIRLELDDSIVQDLLYLVYLACSEYILSMELL